MKNKCKKQLLYIDKCFKQVYNIIKEYGKERPMTERELKKLAKKKGFIKTTFGKGSHEVWKHPDGRMVTIPKPKENDYRPGTLGKILKVLEGE